MLLLIHYSELALLYCYLPLYHYPRIGYVLLFPPVHNHSAGLVWSLEMCALARLFACSPVCLQTILCDCRVSLSLFLLLFLLLLLLSPTSYSLILTRARALLSLLRSLPHHSHHQSLPHRPLSLHSSDYYPPHPPTNSHTHSVRSFLSATQPPSHSFTNGSLSLASSLAHTEECTRGLSRGIVTPAY